MTTSNRGQLNQASHTQRSSPARPETEQLAAQWARIRGRLQQEVGEVVYRTWLRNMSLAGVDGDNVSLLVSASDDAVKAGIHAGNLLKAAASFVGGRGGGQAAHAQGGGKNPAGATAALDAILQALNE